MPTEAEITVAIERLERRAKWCRRNSENLNLGWAASKQLFDIADDIRTLIAAIPRWQPIETAPKDGTPVMLGFDHGKDGFFMTDGYWTEHNGGGWMREYPYQPTHWMPLLRAPQRKDGE